MKMSTHVSCAKNDYLLGNSCVEKTDGKSNRAAQDVLQGKINHEQIRTSTPSKIYSTSLWCMESNALQDHCG